ncbi:hypothetical protein D3C86_1713170 [compost metagenome]
MLFSIEGNANPVLAQFLHGGASQRGEPAGFFPADGATACRFNIRLNITQQIQALIHLRLIHAHRLE